MVETERYQQIPHRRPLFSQMNPMLPNEWTRLALEAAHMCAYRLDLRTDIVVRSHKPTRGFEFDPAEDSWNLRDRSLPNVHPDDRALVEELFLARVRRGEECNIECRLLLPHKEIRWIQINACPIVDETGFAVEAIAVTQDISERKRAEALLTQKNQELLLAQERLKFALESAEMGVLINDRDEPTIRNPGFCRFIGLESTEEIELTSFISMIHPEDLAAFERVFDAQRSGDLRFEHEYRIITPSGTMKWMQAKGTYGRDPIDGIMRDFVVFQDITKRKEQEEILKQKNAEILQMNGKLNRFSAMVAHDLKGPLSSISMAADMLTSSTTFDDVAEYATFTKSAASRMAELINDLLHLAKSDKNSVTEKEVVDLSSVAEVVRTNLRAALTESRAVLEVGPLPVVLGYATQLTQLLQNLISNALKFRGAGSPRVQVSAEQRATEWVIAVKDHGVGIDPAHLGELFEPFKRFHARQFEGTGLGLAICKKAVELHGGTIWVESTPGNGSTFFFTIPKD